MTSKVFWVITLFMPGQPPIVVDLPQHYATRQACETIKYRRLSAIAGTEGVNQDVLAELKMTCWRRVHP